MTNDRKVHVSIAIEAFADDLEARTVGHEITGQFSLKDFYDVPKDIEGKPVLPTIELGDICAIRILSPRLQTLLEWADFYDGNLEYAIEWLWANEDVDDLLRTETIVYIWQFNTVIGWRGSKEEAEAIATFLGLIGATFIIAIPDKDNKDQWLETCDRAGIRHYCESSNVLWQANYKMPYEMRGISYTKDFSPTDLFDRPS